MVFGLFKDKTKRKSKKHSKSDSNSHKKKSSKSKRKKSTKKKIKSASVKKTSKKIKQKSTNPKAKKRINQNNAKKKSTISKAKEKIKQMKNSGDTTPKEVKESKTAPIKDINIDMNKIKKEIEAELQKKPKKVKSTKYIQTGIPGFDEMFATGIPKSTAMLIAGGAGSGKTILCLQTLMHHLKQGKKCLYMSFEESEERLISHMEEFGWNPKKFIKNKKLMVKRFNPFDITRSVDALLMKAKGELLIDVDPILLPENFKPEIIVVDSLTAISSAFTKREDSYRIYIEQLFRFFEEIGANTFLITETKQVPEIYSTTGVEEFLSDGVIVLYNYKRGNVRENGIEILKLRGASHKKKIVAYEITSNGIIVYPNQEVFSE